MINNNARDYKYIIENLFTYDFSVKKHSLSFLLGQSAQYYKYEYFQASVKELPNDLIQVLGAGVKEKDVDKELIEGIYIYDLIAYRNIDLKIEEYISTLDFDEFNLNCKRMLNEIKKSKNIFAIG